MNISTHFAKFDILGTPAVRFPCHGQNLSYYIICHTHTQIHRNIYIYIYYTSLHLVYSLLYGRQRLFTGNVDTTVIDPPPAPTQQTSAFCHFMVQKEYPAATSQIIGAGDVNSMLYYTKIIKRNIATDKLAGVLDFNTCQPNLTCTFSPGVLLDYIY